MVEMVRKQGNDKFCGECGRKAFRCLNEELCSSTTFSEGRVFFCSRKCKEICVEREEKIEYQDMLSERDSL